MSTATVTNEQLAEDKPTQLNSLGQALAVFYRHASPILITITLVSVTSLKIWWGSWSLWDLAAVGLVAAWWPLQEWLAHVFILHMKPRQVMGKDFDLYVSYAHRLHHSKPWVVEHVFVPTRVILAMMLVVLPTILAVGSLVIPFGVVLSGVMAYSVFALIYEWTHFLIHTGYKPKTNLFRVMWRNHRLHHFKNENYWFCVSMLQADYLLRTAPDPSSVAKSDTCRTLGEAYEREVAKG